jgi:hypothetical protein
MTAQFILVQIQEGVAFNRGILSVDEICKKASGCFGKDLLFDLQYNYVGNVLDRWYYTINNGVYKHHERSNEQMINFCTVLEGFTPTFHIGGLLGTKPNERRVFGVFNVEIQKDALVWEGHGYIGGHVSQSHWDTAQEDRKIFDLINSQYYVKDETHRGNTGGYYPKVSYWKE